MSYKKKKIIGKEKECIIFKKSFIQTLLIIFNIITLLKLKDSNYFQSIGLHGPNISVVLFEHFPIDVYMKNFMYAFRLRIF